MGSDTGGTLRIKSRRRHGVFGNNLSSSGSSPFIAIILAELQLRSVVLIVVHVHSTANKPYKLDKKTSGHGG
jgi:hypothetical protein